MNRLTSASRAIGRKVAALSGGQKQRLNLMRGLMLGTDVVVLDEPLNGIDPVSARVVTDLLRRLGAKGVTLVTSTAR